MTSGFRAQVSVEFLLTVMAGMSIAVGAGYWLLQIFSGAGGIVPQTCTFDTGVSCIYWTVASTSSASAFLLIGGNSGQYPLKNLNLLLQYPGGSTTIACTPALIKPGAPFICLSRLSTYSPHGSVVRGNLTMSASNCGLGGASCSSPVGQSFVGAYVVNDTAVTTLQTQLIVSPPRNPSLGVAQINTTMNLFGYNYSLGAIQISSGSGIQPTVTYAGSGTSLVNVSTSTVIKNCIFVVTISYSNITSSQLTFINAKNFSQSGYAVNNNNGFGCVSLASTTTSIAINGNKDLEGIISNPKVSESINIGGANDIVGFVNTTSTNYNLPNSFDNITMYTSNVAFSMGGKYDQMKFINSHISSLTISGNNNLILVHNTTIGSTTIQGKNDIIKNF